MHQPMWDQLLPDPLPEPYRRPYTLVINLDETLVYSTWSVSGLFKSTFISD
jgi:import inner membrane translocase subunit TIM50